jgi:predicted DNA-binding transcriptional regulator AlpA
MSGKKAKLIRRQAKQVPVENWTEEVPHPAEVVEVPPGQNDEKKGAAPVSDVAPLLLTVADVCSLLKFSRTALFRLEKSGDLPGKVKLGGQVRYHREIIEKWLLELVEK